MSRSVITHHSTMDSSTTPLIDRDDLERRQYSTGSPADGSPIVKVLAGFFVSMLVLSSMVAVMYNQLQRPKGGRQSTTATTTSASPGIEVKPSSRGVGWPEKMVGGDDSIEWQRSAYHFQPDKNFISGMYPLMVTLLI